MTQELKRIIFQDKAASQALLKRSSHKATVGTNYRLPTTDCAEGCSQVISQPPLQYKSVRVKKGDHA